MRVAFVLIPRFLFQSHLVHDGPLSRLDADRRERAVLVEGEGGRAQVMAVSRALHELGGRARMTVSSLRARVGEVWPLPFEPERVKRETSRVAGLLLSVGPHLHVAGPGAYRVGAQGWGLLGGESTLWAHLVEQVRAGGYEPPRIGVADTVVAARAAAILERGIVPAGTDESFLAPLPLEVLPLEASTRASLEVLNIRSVSAFAALPARQIADRFGPGAILAHRLARGEDPRQVPAQPPSPEPRLEVEFESPLEVLEPVLFVLQGGLPALMAPHVSRGFGIRCARIELVLVQGSFEREIRAADPLADPRGLLDLCWASLREVNLPSMIQGVRLSVLEVAPATAHQGHLWASSRREGDSLDATLARLQARLGVEAVSMPGPPGDALLPEERARWLKALADPPAAFEATPLIETTAAWRLLRPPPAVFVQLTEGLPRRLRYQGQWQGIRRLGGPERIETGWWNPPSPAADTQAPGDPPVCREYWLAELERGPALTLYRDLHDQAWYLQAVLD